MSEQRVAEETVHAYVDGFLEAPEREAFEQVLRDDPALAARVAEYQRQNAALRALGEALLHAPPAPAARPRRQGRRTRWLAYGAAAASIALAGGLGGWFLRGALAPPDPGRSFSMRAAGAHAVFVPERRHPVEVGADEEAHLVRWLSKKLNTRLVAPNLRPQGYQLVGGRLLSEVDEPAALLMYEDQAKVRVTLYVGPTRDRATPAAFQVEERGGVVTCYWVEGSMGYAISGALPRPQLLQLARVVYDQLEKR